jgi:arylsulfatase A-like enzyme
MDLLPTFARLAKADLPKARILDGHDIWPLLAGKAGAGSPYKAFYYYQMDQLQAVRSGKWKLYLPLEQKLDLGGRGKPGAMTLYDLEADVGETSNLAGREPQVVARLLALAEEARQDLGDLGRPGKSQRPAGWVDRPRAQVIPQRANRLQ